MTKDTTKEAAAAEGLLFDDWFDAIEDGVRARVNWTPDLGPLAKL